MALRLLRAQYMLAAVASRDASRDASDVGSWKDLAECDARRWAAWLPTLPQRDAVIWPPGDFNAAEVSMLKEHTLMQEMNIMARNFEEDWQVGCR